MTPPINIDELPPPPTSLSNFDNIEYHNLKKATQRLRAMQPEKQPPPQSTTKGVTWHERDEKWTTRVTVQGITYRCGMFKKEQDAVNAVKEKRASLMREEIVNNHFL